MNVSDKVVFIGDHGDRGKCTYDPNEWNYVGGPLEVGKVYVVEDITICNYTALGKMFALYLVGKKAYNKTNKMDVPYPAHWFRKLEDIKNENKKNVSANV